MELTSNALCCYTTLDLPLTKFGKSAALISPSVHFITARLRYAPSHDRSPASFPPPQEEQRRPALLMQNEGRQCERLVQK